MFNLAERETAEIYNDYGDELDQLLDEMFLSEERIESKREWELKKQQLKEIYLDLLYDSEKPYHNSVPSLFDVVMAVNDYNENILIQIVGLDYNAGVNGTYYEYAKMESEDGDDIMDMLYQCWCEDIEAGTTGGIDTECMITKMLHELGYSVSLEESISGYYEYQDWPDGSVLYICDCQNLLIPEWHLESLLAYDYLGKDEKMNLRLISE